MQADPALLDRAISGHIPGKMRGVPGISFWGRSTAFLHAYCQRRLH
jgi:hypothetical protein